MSAVSFLDDLKRQAATLRTPVSTESVVDLERNTRLANGACRITRDYWKELTEQLNVIAPPSKARYLVDARNPLEELRCRNFRMVPVSRKDHQGEEHFESVMLLWQAGSGKRVRVEKVFPGEIERARAALRQACIQFHEEGIRQGENGRTAGVALEFMAEVTASVRVLPLCESGRVKLVFTNVDQLERVEAEFPAVGMRLRQLDEIAKWIVGAPHRVLEYASEVKRFQS